MEKTAADRPARRRRLLVYVALAALVALLMLRLMKRVSRMLVLSGPVVAATAGTGETRGRAGVFRLTNGRYALALRLNKPAAGDRVVVLVHRDGKTLVGRLRGGRASADFDLKRDVAPRPGNAVVIADNKGRALFKAYLDAAPGHRQ